jgi:hypothetical protein
VLATTGYSTTSFEDRLILVTAIRRRTSTTY